MPGEEMTEWAHKFYNEKISHHFSRWLVARGITANQVTIFNFFFTVILGCYFFSRGVWWANYVALGVMAISVVLDYADGDVARKTNTLSVAGAWLDNGGDVVLQNSIMAAIACGIGAPYLTWIVVYFVANTSLNMVSQQYNNRFGFDSYKGSALFRKYMDSKSSLVNDALKGIVDPTAYWYTLFLFTVRYWIVIGVLLNRMPGIFEVITIYTVFRCAVMFIIYSLYLTGSKKLWVLQALAVLDEENAEYWKCRKLTT